MKKFFTKENLPGKKSVLTYIGGILTGVVLSLLIIYCQNSGSNVGDITMYESPRDVFNQTEFSVVQTDDDGSAIAVAPGDIGFMAALFLAKDGKSYYDGQTIHLSVGKVFRQVGTFRYEDNNGKLKTIPILDEFNH